MTNQKARKPHSRNENSRDVIRRAVIELLEQRCLLSHIAGGPSAVVESPYSVDLVADNPGTVKSWAVNWGDGTVQTTGTYSVDGAGAGISGTSDALHLVYQQLTGDGIVMARVSSPATGGYVGLMARQSLGADAANGFVGLTSAGAIFQSRASQGASTAGSSPTTAGNPTWLKLTRSGNTLSGYLSADGVQWTAVGTSAAVSLPQTIYIGLAVDSGLTTATANAAFDNLSIQSANPVVGSWTDVEIGQTGTAGHSSLTGGNLSSVQHVYHGAPANYRVTAQYLDATGLHDGGALGPDKQFGVDGKIVTDVGFTWGSTTKGLVQADGKVIVGIMGSSPGHQPSLIVLRYNRDGTLDTSFGQAGKLTTPFFSGTIALLSNGMLLVSGVQYSESDIGITRYSPTGQLDTTFGNGGIASYHTYYSPTVTAMAVGADGKMVVTVADNNNPTYTIRYDLVRFNSNGTLDNSFGTNGVVFSGTFFGNPYDENNYASSVAIQPDGKILVAGDTVTDLNSDWTTDNWLLARYNVDGTLDTTFGNNGRAIIWGGYQLGIGISDIALQPDHKIVAVGSGWNGSYVFESLLRFNPDGSQDTTLNVTNLLGLWIQVQPISSVALEADGGVVTVDQNHAARYSSTGQLDSSFGVGGTVATVFDNGGNAQATGVAVGADGKIVVVGSPDGKSVGVARFGPTNAVSTFPPAVVARAFTATEGSLFSDRVGSFTASDTTAADYSATIAWGDGTTDAGTIQGNAVSGFDVFGSHTYRQAGAQTFSVTVVHNATGARSAASGTVTIADATLLGSPLDFNAPATVPFQGTIASFNDDNSQAAPSDFLATIDWGDGSPASTGTVTWNSATSQFDVGGSHTYSAQASAILTVRVQDLTGASTATIKSTVTVSAPAPFINGPSVGDVQQPMAFKGVVPAGTSASAILIWNVIRTDNVGVGHAPPTVATGSGSDFTFRPWEPGTFEVDLTVYDGTAAPVVVSKTFTVQTVPPQNLRISGGAAAKAQQLVFLFANFDGSQSTDPDSATTYQWSVTKDGVAYSTNLPTNLQTFIFLPQNAGDYVVSVSVSAWGGSASATTTIHVATADAAGSNPTVLQNTVPVNVPGLSFVRAAAMQPDGKLVVGGSTPSGDFALERYKADFSGLDPTFGSADHPGIVITDFHTVFSNVGRDSFSSYGGGVQTIAIQPDGKIIAAGRVYTNTYQVPAYDYQTLALARYNADGSLDQAQYQNGTMTYAGFGPTHSGLILEHFPDIPGVSNFNGSIQVFTSIALTPEGRILVGGTVGMHPSINSAGELNQFAIVAYTPSGLIDTSFGDPNYGGGGYVYLNPEGLPWGDETVTILRKILVQPDGKILAIGDTFANDKIDRLANDESVTGESIAVARFNSDGTLDQSYGNNRDAQLGLQFGGGGFVRTHVAQYSRAFVEGASLQPDGKLVIAGYAQVATDSTSLIAGPPTQFLVTRFNADGSLDASSAAGGGSSFGINGSVLANFSDTSGSAIASDLAIGADGSIIVGGVVNLSNEGGQWGIARFTPQGAPDLSFGDTDPVTGQRTGLTTFGQAIIYTWGEDDGAYNSTYLSAHAGAFLATSSDLYLVHTSIDPTNPVDSNNNPVASNDFAALRYHLGSSKAVQLVATASTQGPVDLQWAVSGDGSGGYSIYRTTDLAVDSQLAGSSASWSLIANVGGDQTQYSDSTVSPGTQYRYVLVPTTGSGLDVTARSNVATATTAPVDTNYVLIDTVPVSPTGEVSLSNVSLNAGQTYQLRASGNVQIKGPTNLNAGINDLEFRSDPQYGHWNPLPSSNSTWVGHGLVAYGIGVNDTALSMNRYPYWGPANSTPNGSYAVSFTPSAMGQVKFNFHDDYYGDNSVDAEGSPLTVQIWQAQTQSPSSLVAASDRISHSVTLTWKYRTTTLPDYFKVERSTDGQPFEEVGSVGGKATSYLDAGVAPNHAYTYRLLAHGAGGDSAYSNLAYAMVVSQPPVISPIPPQLVAQNGDLAYQVQARNSNGDATGLSYALTLPAGSPSIQIDSDGFIHGTNLSASGNFPIVVQVTDLNNNSVAQRTFLLTVQPPAAGAPTLSGPATASLNANQSIVHLTVPAAVDSDGETHFTYTWSMAKGPLGAAPPTFSTNGTATASDTTAQLSVSGYYLFRVTVTDPSGNSVTSSASVTAVQVLSGVKVSGPSNELADYNLAHGGSAIFQSQGVDQFGIVIPSTTGFQWSVDQAPSQSNFTLTPNSTGTQASGVMTTAGLYLISARLSTFSASWPLTVDGSASVQPPAISPPDAWLENDHTLQLSTLGSDSAGEANLKYSWTVTGPNDLPLPAGTPVPTFSDNGTNSAKTTRAVFPGIVPLNTTYKFTVTATNALGLSASDNIVVTAKQDLTSVEMTPALPTMPINGGVVHFASVARDAYGRPMPAGAPVTFNWTVDAGTANAVTGSGPALDYTVPGTVGQHTVQVSATYNDGTTTTTKTASTILSVVSVLAPFVKFTSPTPTTQPTDLSQLLQGAGSGPVTQTTNVISEDTKIAGVIFGLRQNTPYTITMTPQSGGSAVTIATGSGSVGTPPAGGADLGTIHPASFQPGLYTLTLQASQDGQTYIDSETVEIRSNLNLGNLSLPFNDLTFNVPGGAPLSVTRVYDSSRANETGDFGKGWFLDSNQAAVTTTAQPGELGNATLPAFRYGDLVYINLPGGQRYVFEFTPRPIIGANSSIMPGSPYQLGSFAPMFVPADGSSATLTVATDGTDPFALSMDSNTGEFQGGAFSQGYNPANPSFGGRYFLKTADGTTYTVNATAGLVSQAQDLNGNTITYGASGVGSNGWKINFTRDSQNRITAAQLVQTVIANGVSTDVPIGNPIIYAYTDSSIAGDTDNGELKTVTDQANNTTHYAYWTDPAVGSAPTMQLLSRIVDPRHLVVLQAEYIPNSNGQLKSIQNAYASQSAPVSTGDFTGTTARQTVTDLSHSSIENVYNAQGNVVRRIRAVTDTSGAVQKYVVAVTDYSYARGDVWDAWKFNNSVQNLLTGVTAYQPFEIPGSDPAGLRYTQLPTAIAHEETFSNGGDTLNDPNIKMLTGESVTDATGQLRTTQIGTYTLGKPETITDANGNQTWSKYDAAGNLDWTINALGEGMLNVYNGDRDPVTGLIVGGSAAEASLPKGLLYETYRIVDHAANPLAQGAPAPTLLSTVPDTTNSYYTSTDTSQGWLAGMLWKTTNNVTGLTNRFTYYADGKQKEVYRDWTDAAGHAHDVRDSLTVYDSAGRPFSVTDANNQVTKTYYNALGKPLVTVDSFGGQTLYTYDARGNLIQTLYPDHTETRTTYDVMGRAEWTSDRFVSTSAFAFDEATQTLMVTNTDTTATYLVTHSTYDALGRAVGTERYKNAQIVLAADAAVTTDGTAGVSVLTAVAPNPATFTKDQQISTTSTQYDAQGRVSVSTGADGSKSLTQYYPNGQVLRTRQVGAPGVPVAGPTDWTTQDSDRRELDVVTLNSSVAAGAVFSLQLPVGNSNVSVSVTAAAGATGSSILSALASEIDALPNSPYVASAADGYMTLDSGTSRAAVFTALVSSNLVDFRHLDQAVASGEYQNNWTVDPLGHVSVSGQDMLANKSWSTRFNDDPGATPAAVTTTTITSIGGQANAAQGQTVPAGQGAFEREVTKVDAIGVATESFYDAAGRLTDVWQPPVAYQSTDPITAAVTSPPGSTAQPHWQYGYDANDNQITQTDPLVHTTTFAYDDQGRRTSRTLPDSTVARPEVESWTYDSFGRALTHTDFKGQTSAEVYDTDPAHGGRLAAEYRFNAGATVFSGGVLQTANAAEETAYGYDSLGRQNQVTEYAGSPLVQTRQTTEQFDPITGGVVQVASNEGVVNHAYDPATGRLIRTWTGTSLGTLTEDTRYGYDALGRLSSVSATTLGGSTFNAAEVTRYAYDGAGDLASVTTPEGVKTSYFYDGLNRLHEETTTRPGFDTSGNPVVLPVSDYTYALRSDGLRTGVMEKTWNAAGTTFSTIVIGWGYDNLNRLTSETRQNQTPGLSAPDVNDYTATYQFDLAGNRTQYMITKPNVTGQNDTQTSAYNGDDQLTLANSTLSGTTGYGYDLNGSLTTQTHTPPSGASDTQTYTWDLRNRMATATVGGATTTYGYDSDGFRVSESTGGGTRTFLPDAINPTGNEQALEERVNGTLDRAYILGVRVEGQEDAQGVVYLLRDGHGSTRQLADDQGRVITNLAGNPLLYSYDAYGSSIGFDASSARTTQLFGGDGEYDPATGMTYHDARFRQGYRFISMDSYGGITADPLSLHKYLYADGNPINGVDPSGHVDLVETMTVTGMGSAAAAVTSNPTLVAQAEAELVAAGEGLLSTAETGIADAEALVGEAAGQVRELVSEAYELVSTQVANQEAAREAGQIGTYWNELGAAGENIVGKTVELATQGKADIVRNELDVLGTKLDIKALSDAANAVVEVKYSLQSTDPAQVTRAINQLTNASLLAGPNDPVILFVMRQPTAQELTTFLGKLDPSVVHKVEVMSNVAELYTRLKSVFQ